MTDDPQPAAQTPTPHLDAFHAGVLRRRRREIPAGIGLGVVAAVFVAGGVIAQITGMVVFGGWIAGFVALSLRGRRLRSRGEAGQGPRGRIEPASLDGIPATILREHPAYALHSALGLGYIGLLFLLPLLAWGDLEVGQRVAVGALGVPFFIGAWRRVRWARQAGVWLTQHEVVVKGWGQTRWVRWPDVGLIAPGALGPFPMVHVMSREESGVHVWGRSRLYPGLEPAGHIVIFTQHTALDAGLTAQVLVYLVRSGDRSIIGTGAGPALVRSIIAR